MLHLKEGSVNNDKIFLEDVLLQFPLKLEA